MPTKTTVKTAVETPQVGNWVELKKSRSGSNILVKGSRWQIEAIAPDRNDPNRKVCKVNNGRLGDNNQIDFLYLDEISPTERWQKGDVVQSIEDPRLIGMVTKLSQSTIGIKWAGKATEEYLVPDAIILFARMVGGDQQIISEYAFKPGDRVVADFENFKGEVFTVRECYPSGMVGVTDEKGNDRSFSGSWLTVISHQSPVVSQESGVSDQSPVTSEQSLLETDPPRQEEENGQLSIFWNPDEPPDPDDFGGDTPEYREAWRQWEANYPDLAEAVAKRNQASAISENNPPVPGDFRTFQAFKQAWQDYGETLEGVEEEEFWLVSAKEIWEQTYSELLDEYLVDHFGPLNLQILSDSGIDSVDKFIDTVAKILELDRSDCEDLAREYYSDLIWPGGINLQEIGIDLNALDVEVMASEEENLTVCDQTDEWINPSLIRTDITQTRREEDQAHIKKIKDQMLAGEWQWEREPLPEFIKTEDGYYYPVSGNHRSKAVQLANQERENPFQIFGRVKTGTVQDAQIAAIRSTSNNYHGIPESDADYRCRIEKLLDLIRTWDNATLIQEIRTIQPNDKVSPQRIESAIKDIENGTNDLLKGLSSRLIASYLHRPKSFDVVSQVMTTYCTKERFKLVLALLSEGDSVRFTFTNGQEYEGKVHLVTAASATVQVGGKGLVINLNSPTDILGSIVKIDSPEPSPPPIPQRKKKSSGGGGGSSVRSELRKKARSLGLPTSSEQVLPDMTESDRLRNSSPYDVNDQLFAERSPTPEELRRDYLIAFKTNVVEMDAEMVAEGLMSFNEWLVLRGRQDLMQKITDLATEIKTLE